MHLVSPDTLLVHSIVRCGTFAPHGLVVGARAPPPGGLLRSAAPPAAARRSHCSSRTCFTAAGPLRHIGPDTQHLSCAACVAGAGASSPSPHSGHCQLIRTDDGGGRVVRPQTHSLGLSRNNETHSIPAGYNSRPQHALRRAHCFVGRGCPLHVFVWVMGSGAGQL